MLDSKGEAFGRSTSYSPSPRTGKGPGDRVLIYPPKFPSLLLLLLTSPAAFSNAFPCVTSLLTLWDFNLALHQVVASCLDLAHLPSPSSAEPYPLKGELDKVSYYQVFSARTGFLPDLSIVDLIFNMGPEARLWL